jgi:phosphoribosyl 1,2-cyclic phosphodiesterase
MHSEAGAMAVTFHGVRGSTPCHGEEITRYGGNTSCVSLDVPGHDPILFDLGTGLRYFGLTHTGDEPFNGTVLLSHLHWDHIQGLPFFKPLLREGAAVAVYAPSQPDGLTVEQVFADTIKPPLFPIHFAMLPGMVEIHEVGDDEFWIGDAHVTSRLIPHVGHTVGYRVEWGGRSVAYLSDHQMPSDGSFAATEAAFDLCRGVDLLIHDSQYTPSEFTQKRDWGHCTPEYAVWLAAKAGVRRLALFHHDPAHDDDMLDQMSDAAIECGARSGLEVFAARERSTVSV